MCAKGATVKLRGAPPMRTAALSLRRRANRRAISKPEFETALAERMITLRVRNRCQQLRSPRNRYPFPSPTSSARRRRWKSLNPKRAPICPDPAPTWWFRRRLRRSPRHNRKKFRRRLRVKGARVVPEQKAKHQGAAWWGSRGDRYLADRGRGGVLPSAWSFAVSPRRSLAFVWRRCSAFSFGVC
jgi:hypothetical protein